jgi:hypothetical protein
MRFLLTLFLLVNTCAAQVSIYFDDMESPPTWRGVSTTGTNSSFIGGISSAIDNPANRPFYSTPDSCYCVRGVGLGSSAIEVDTFVYPNVPLVSGHQYQIRYKMASFGLNSSVQTAAGVDASDWIELQYSVNNGLSWWRDAQVQGQNNAMWAFSGLNGTMLNITRNGSMSTTTPTVYVSNPNMPIVNMWVTLPLAVFTQVKIRFVTQINASGETWMLEDVSITDMTPTLPIELIEFNGRYYNQGLKLYWSTSSEINNDYFILYKSFDGTNFQEVTKIKGRGNSNTMVKYEYVDHDLCEGIVYYNLKQVDYDGNSKEFDIIAFQCRSEYIIEKFTDILGRKIGQEYDGIKVYYK